MHEHHHATGTSPGGKDASPPIAHHAQLSVDYFDGHTTCPHRAQMWIEDSMLQLAGRDLIRQVPLSKVRWPERTRHGFRLAHMADGASVQALNVEDWDRWVQQHQLDAPQLVQAQPSWRWTVLAACLLLTLTVMGCWWGLSGRPLSPVMPRSVDKQVGHATFSRPAPTSPVSISATSAKATAHARPTSA